MPSSRIFFLLIVTIEILYLCIVPNVRNYSSWFTVHCSNPVPMATNIPVFHILIISEKFLLLILTLCCPSIPVFLSKISSFPYRETHGRKQTLKHENEATNVHSYYFDGGYAWKTTILINFASLLLFFWI